VNPSQDIDAERSVLGAMLLSRSVIQEIAESVQGQDFYRPAHETIFDTILDLNGRGEPVDAVTVVAALLTDGKLDRAGGPSYLHDLAAACPTPSVGAYYAGIVAGHGARRRLVQVAGQLRQRAEEGGDIDTLTDEARAAMETITSSNSASIRPVSETIDATLDSLDEPVTYTETPWVNVNHFIQGWRPGALYIIAARPSVGKTVAGFQAALSLANRGPVAFTSLEMDHTELELRMVSQEARVDMHRITSRRLTNADWERVANARGRWGTLPLFIDKSADATMGQVARHAWAVKRKHGLAAVVVDYLGLLEHTDKRKSEYEVVTEHSRKLKLLAKALGVPVIVLSQLNRGSESREGRVPQLSDLRSSGAIEQDADVVILMHRDLMESPHEADLIVAKNRHGITGTAHMDFIGHNSYIRDRNRPEGYAA
jgi:replicative DNA helicase